MLVSPNRASTPPAHHHKTSKQSNKQSHQHYTLFVCLSCVLVVVCWCTVTRRFSRAVPRKGCCCISVLVCLMCACCVLLYACVLVCLLMHAIHKNTNTNNCKRNRERLTLKSFLPTIKLQIISVKLRKAQTQYLFCTCTISYV